MNGSIVFGLFALYVAVISLYTVLVGQQDALLAFLRRCWGRSRGHSLYFLVHVVLPMLVAVLCLGWGVRQYDASIAFESLACPVHLNVEAFRDLRMMLEKQPPANPLGVIYGA